MPSFQFSFNCTCCGVRGCSHCFSATPNCGPSVNVPIYGASITLTNGTDTWTGTTDGRLVGINVTSGGGSYDPYDPPVVNIIGGGGSNALATAILAGGVPSASVATAGGGYTKPSLTLNGGTTGRIATVNYSCHIDALVFNSGGGGYVDGVGYPLTFTGGSPSVAASGTFDVVGGVVTNVNLTSPGSGYKESPTVGFSAAGPGVYAFVRATLAFTSVSVSNGMLYIAPSLTVSDPTGSGATFNASATTISVGSIRMDSYGQGFTSTPTVSITTTSTGSGATATAQPIRVIACLPDVPTGSYTRTVSATGYGTSTSTVSITHGASCGPANTTSVSLPPIGHLNINWFVLGCGSQIHGFDTGNPLPGATVTMTGSGGLSATGMTDASGLLTLSIGPFTGTLASWSGTVSYPGFFNRNITGAPNVCAGSTFTQQIRMVAASLIPPTTGWICIPGPSGQCGPYSFELTDLTVTDSKNGSTTLTYLGLSGSGYYNWEGSQAGTFDASASCPASSGTVTYGLTLNPVGGWGFGVSLTMEDAHGFGCDCPGPGSPPCTSNTGCGVLISNSYTCPPAFMLVFSLDPSASGAGLCLGAYGTGGGTFTITQ